MTDGWEEVATVAARRGTLPQSGATDDVSELRSSASKWQTTQLGIIGLVSVVGVVKGGQDVGDLPTVAGIAVGLLLGVAFFAALLAIYLVAFVGYRLPRLRAWRGDDADADVTTWRTVEQAARRLRTGVALTFTASFLMAAAVAVSWYAPQRSEGVAVEVTAPGVAYCGQLVGVDAGRAIVVVDGVRTTVPAGASLDPVASCP